MTSQTAQGVRYLSAESRTKDDFGDKITGSEGEVIYDAKTMYGAWACMTEASFTNHGYGLTGTGYGQKYVRNGDGHLVKTEG